MRFATHRTMLQKETTMKIFFTFKWPEMGLFNTKGNVKQKWGKRKGNKVLLRIFFRFSLTWKKNDKIGYDICQKAEMANTKSHRNQRKFILHRSQSNQFTGYV